MLSWVRRCSLRKSFPLHSTASFFFGRNSFTRMLRCSCGRWEGTSLEICVRACTLGGQKLERGNRSRYLFSSSSSCIFKEHHRWERLESEVRVLCGGGVCLFVWCVQSVCVWLEESVGVVCVVWCDVLVWYMCDGVLVCWCMCVLPISNAQVKHVQKKIDGCHPS